MSSLLLLLAPTALACGPFLPRCLLAGEVDLSQAPVGDFSAALHAMGADPHGVTATGIALLEADRLDAEAALASVPKGRREELLHEYTTLRAAMIRPTSTWPPPTTPWVAPPVPIAAADLPPELADWLVGAARFHVGDPEGAFDAFEHLLALPPEQRVRKTVWAEFMLGRMSSSDEERNAHFERAREAVRDGFSDTHGLGCESYGEQAARIYEYQPKIELYLAQVACGDEGAVASLVEVVHGVFTEGDETLDALVRDPVSAEVIAAWLVSRGDFTLDEGPTGPRQRWQAAVERTGTVELAGADRLGWAAYRAGAPEEARRWLAVAPASPIAKWLRAKLAMREGDFTTAESLMATLDRPDQVAGERGVLLLRQQRYVEALDSFLHSPYWLDAAYVAERVLTVDELVGFVDARYPAPIGVQPAAWDIYSCDDDRCPDVGRVARLRWLLARRLAREGRLDDAVRYAPPAFVGWYRLWQHVDAIRVDPTAPDEARGMAGFHEALLVRHLGMELRGMELDSDFTVFEGQFTEYPIVSARSGRTDPLGPTLDESARVERSVSIPDRRFHYRWLAAELAWEAAGRMPDNDERTAQILCVGGGWIHLRDPDRAWPFYREMQRRTPEVGFVDDGGWPRSDGYRCTSAG